MVPLLEEERCSTPVWAGAEVDGGWRLARRRVGRAWRRRALFAAWRRLATGGFAVHGGGPYMPYRGGGQAMMRGHPGHGQFARMGPEGDSPLANFGAAISESFTMIAIISIGSAASLSVTRVSATMATATTMVITVESAAGSIAML